MGHGRLSAARSDWGRSQTVCRPKRWKADLVAGTSAYWRRAVTIGDALIRRNWPNLDILNLPWPHGSLSISYVGSYVEERLRKGSPHVIKRERCAAAFNSADDFRRRHAEKSDIHRSCCGNFTDRDQSWRRDTVWGGPGDLESDSHLLCSVLRDHLGSNHGQKGAVEAP